MHSTGCERHTLHANTGVHMPCPLCYKLPSDMLAPPGCLVCMLQSYIHGLFVGRFDPAAVALEVSRGYETYFSKQLMRWTVLLSDLLGE